MMLFKPFLMYRSIKWHKLLWRNKIKCTVIICLLWQSTVLSLLRCLPNRIKPAGLQVDGQFKQFCAGASNRLSCDARILHSPYYYSCMAFFKSVWMSNDNVLTYSFCFLLIKSQRSAYFTVFKITFLLCIPDCPI